MAEFITDDDRKIRDLQLQETPLLNDFLAIDRVGAFEAFKITIQQIVTMAASSTPGAKAYSGNVNPDNAFGANGDLYYTIPANGSSLKMFQKAAGVWALVFNLPLPVPVTINFTGSAIDTDTGTLPITGGNIGVVGQRKLLCVTIDNVDKGNNFEFNRIAGTIQGFGGSESASNIVLTFI